MGVTKGRANTVGSVAFSRSGVPWTRQGQRLLIAATFALLASALLLLADATGAVPASLLPHTPLHARNAHAMAAASATSTPTETPQPKIPVITLVSPSSGQGPVGAHVTISGHDFSGSSATINATTQPDCGGSQGALTTPSINGGSFTTTFIWPTNLGNGTYYLCATGMTSGAPTYQVISSAPPTLSLSVSTAFAGDTITVTGSNFVGYPNGTSISITESANGAPRTLTNATLGDGSFSVSETLSKDIVGSNVTINAYSTAETAGGTPVLQASASLTVQGSTPTPTVTVAPTASTVGGITSANTDANNKSGSAGLIVLLIVGIVLALLVILGVVAYLVLRGRGGGEPGADGNGYGGFGGQHSTGPHPGYGQSATGRYPQANQFGRSGVFEPPNAYTEPYAGPPVGGVSQWDDPDPTPGPDWQPRPMTGFGLADSDKPNDPYGQHPDYPGNASQQPVRQGTYPPVDPWDAPTNQSNQPGRGSGAAYPPPTNASGTTGRTRAAGPTGTSSQARPQPGWSDEPTDGSWGGSGATRPGTNAPNQWDQPSGNEPGW